jgi:hypothetical protein
VQIVNSFQIPDFNKALRKVWSLPDNTSITEIRELGDDWEEAAFQIRHKSHTGFLVGRQIATDSY